MPGEGEEWLPLILRCLSRSSETDLKIEEADSLRTELQKKGLNPGAIALVLLQLEDVDPSMRRSHDIDGYC